MVQKMDSDLPDFVGREKKGQAALRRLFFLAAEEVGKTCLWRQARTEKLPMRTVVVCPRREDWIGRDFRLPQAWKIKSYRNTDFSIHDKKNYGPNVLCAISVYLRKLNY